ncbi:SRPBCC family protein [Paraburkholderia aspalathi]|uniref:SRPBCC family protein n=1 Tax=Paraburkholderia aspalathi TaxID=1324617 RepID=UPI0038B885A8
MAGSRKRTATDYGANMGLPKWWLKSVIASVVGIVGVLFIMHEDSSVRADVLIARPPSDVWNVISDSAAYPDWNPFITRVDGDFREGATIRIVLGSGSDSMVFKPTVLLVRPGQDLCWRGSVWIRGVFDGKHCIHLTAVPGGTHLEQTERFSGLLVGRLTKDVVEDTRQSFQAMNTAVKLRAESKAP